MSGEISVQASIRDISVRKSLERDIFERRKELEMLQKFQVAAQTAAAFAHELNQPLSAISSYGKAALMILERESPDLRELRRAVERSEQQALRAGESIRGMVVALNIGEFPVEQIDLNQEVQAALVNARSEHDLQIGTQCKFDDRLPPIQVNPTHVRKILLNLFHNSIEAMQEASVPEPTIVVSISVKQDENLALVTIRDNGPGISAENSHRLFEPFFTSKSSGIGFGLAISRSLAEMNGGQLWLDPHEKAGATFRLTLPFAL